MPWEKFEVRRRKTTYILKNIIGIRAKEIAISNDLASKHFKDAENILGVEIFINKDAGEVGFHPSKKGYSLRQRKRDGAKGAYIFHARAFLRLNPIEKGRYEPRWDQDKQLLIIKAWSPEQDEESHVIEKVALPREERSEETEKVDFCPRCEELGYKDGVCPHCGYHEEACPEGLHNPLEKEDDVCRDCEFYKRKWGQRPARRAWAGWTRI